MSRGTEVVAVARVGLTTGFPTLPSWGCCQVRCFQTRSSNTVCGVEISCNTQCKLQIL